MPFGGLLTAGVSAGSGLLSGVFGSKAAKKAAQQQAASQQQAIGVTQGAVQSGQQGVTAATGQGQANVAAGVSGATNALSPYASLGPDAIASLKQLAGGQLSQQFSFNPSDLQSDPGYAFTLQQGQDAIQRSAAAQGKLFSGGTLKSLAGYTTGTANQYFNDAFNRAQSTFNTNRQGALAQVGIAQGLLGTGASAAGQSAQDVLSGSEYGAGLGEQGAVTNAQIGLGGAGQVGGYLTNQGNAQAAGTVGSTNSWLGALNGGNTAILNYLKTAPTNIGTNPSLIPTLDAGPVFGSGQGVNPVTY